MAISKEAVKADLDRQQKVYDAEEQEKLETRQLAIERFNGPSAPIAEFRKKMRAHLKKKNLIK